ncbi:MAG: hypothetical protein KC635_25610 [Myxococcales bacterium]|nr:hypothetical protein [Myxococcales bacterium]
MTTVTAPALSRAAVAALTAVAALLLTACGDPGGSSGLVPTSDTLAGDAADAVAGDTTTTTAGDTETADTAPVDTGAPTDTVVADTADTTPPGDTGPTELGVGVLLGEIDAPGLNVAFAAARLTRVPVPPDTSGTSYPPCRVAHVDPNAAETVRYGLDGGAITVTGTNPGVTLSPSPDGAAGTKYTSSLPDDQESLLPGGGAIVSVSGAGGADVAAFSGVLQMPEPVTISLPATGLGRKANPQVPLTVTWNKGTGQQVVVSLNPLGPTGEAIAGKAVICDLTGDEGTVTIPSAALVEAANLPSPPLMALGVTRIRAGTASNAAYRIPLTATRSNGGPLSLSE